MAEEAPSKRAKASRATARRVAAKPPAAGSSDSASGRAAGTAAVPPEEPTGSTTPRLLSGGNPQIAKGYGEAPVAAFIAAMPGWKSEVGRRLDALIVRTVPEVRKAVKWNTPLYGIEGDGWFLGFHCFTKYIKVTFFRGQSLDPVPPVASKSGDTRYFHIHEGDTLDEAHLADWIRQASRLPGERM